MNRVLLEVCVSSVEDAVDAAEAGADRLELHCAPTLGGLTPSVGLFREVLAATTKPVTVLIRPRPGEYVWNESEFRVMLRDVSVFQKLGAEGFAFSCTHDDGRVHSAMARELIRAAAGKPTVFHRGFDFCPNHFLAVENLIEIQCTRIVTSGGPSRAEKGIEKLKDLHRRYGHRIEIQPAGMIKSENVVSILKATGLLRCQANCNEPASGKLIAERVRHCRLVLDRMTAG